MIRGFEKLFTALVTIVAALFVALALAPAASVFGSLTTDAGRLWLATPVKLISFLVGFLAAFRVAAQFDRGSKIRLAWLLIAFGFGFFGLGQLALAPYQLLWNLPAPFPSVADAFFMLGYPFFIGSLFLFRGAYDEAGFPLPSASAQQRIALAVGVACLLIAYPLLAPLAKGGSSTFAVAVTLAYPILDLVLLVPVALLIRITWALRGGELAGVWMNVLAGILFLCAGDIIFGYLSAGNATLDALLHATYIIAYGAMARGVLRQYLLTASTA